MNYQKYIVKVYQDGSIEWFQNKVDLNGNVIEVRHRENGPAIEWGDGKTKKYYQDGLLHREDGPAILYRDGGKHWYLGGVEYTEREFLKKITRSRDGEIVEIDGKKYKLTEIEE